MEYTQISPQCCSPTQMGCTCAVKSRIHFHIVLQINLLPTSQHEFHELVSLAARIGTESRESSKTHYAMNRQSTCYNPFPLQQQQGICGWGCAPCSCQTNGKEKEFKLFRGNFKFVVRDAFKAYSKLKRWISALPLSSILQNNLLESAGFSPVSLLLIPKGVGKYLWALWKIIDHKCHWKDAPLDSTSLHRTHR